MRARRERLAEGPLWRDHDLVFASQVGTPLDASHVRRSFKSITRKAGSDEVYWHQLKPMITKGAETMNIIFNQHKQAKSA